MPPADIQHIPKSGDIALSDVFFSVRVSTAYNGIIFRRGTLDTLTLAPCGVVCELCIGFQRSRNRCVGCNSDGNKMKHCIKCSIRLCPEKQNRESLCLECVKYPCRRLRDFGKRYLTKYGEDVTGNMQMLLDGGYSEFEKGIRARWTCRECGNLLSAHRSTCTNCGKPNPNYPAKV